MRKRLFIFIIFCLFIIQNPVLAKEKLSSTEKKQEINTIGQKIEYFISQNKNYQACFYAYEMINHYPEEPDSYFAYAKANHHAGFPDRAIEYYQKCLKLDNKYHQALFNIGLIKYQQQQYTESVKYYTKAIHAISDKNKYKKDYAYAYSNRAIAKYYNGNLKSALKDYNKSLSIMSDYKGVDHVYFNRGLCKYDLGDKEGADEDFNTAKKLNPKFKYIYYNQRG